MNDWLMRYAINNAWQNPGIDGALTIAPQRLSIPTGVVGFFKYGNSSFGLPGKGWWHVFEIGKFHINRGNIAVPSNLWTPLMGCANTFDTWFCFYNENGRSVPLSKVFIYRTSYGETFLAVKQEERYNWIETDDIYLRLFPGYNGANGDEPNHPIVVEFFNPPNPQEVNRILDRYNQLKAANCGYVEMWVNGILIKNPTPNDIPIWGDIEIKVDGRVVRYIDFQCGELRTFSSELDKARKYLLHIPKGQSEWTFNDDCEIQVFLRNEGRYYHLNQHAAIRQVTWNDLSIPTKRVSRFRATFKNADDLDLFVIRLIIRDDHLTKPPFHNATHTHDLYRLDDEKIIDAMVGANSNVPEWTASRLEQSAVNYLAAAKMSNINRALATNAYGYNAITRLIGDTPQILVNDGVRKTVRLPPLLAMKSTVYEYDRTGMLLAVNPNITGELYQATSAAAYKIEAIHGESSDALTITDNAQDFDIKSGENVGLWLRVVKNDIPTDEYLPAVEGKDYTKTGSHIAWTVDRTRRHPTVVYDDKHLFNSVTVAVRDGDIRIPIVARNQDGLVRTFKIPMETVEVWLNKHPLVQGIDYHVRWPEICVVCKAWVSDTEDNVVDIRIRGQSGTNRLPKNGFISSGLLSNNSRFDVRDDKVIRVVAGGCLMSRDEIVFREDNTVGTNVIADGFPYSIDDPTIPMRDFAEGETYPLRDIARDLDFRIEDYLTTWFPTPPPVSPVPISNLYHLYSPVLNKIIWDYKQGTLRLVEDDPDFRISTAQLDEIMKRYNGYLDFDPAYIGFDEAFVKVHPHIQYKTVEIDELGFAFLDRVNARYLKNIVQLNQYLIIKG